MEKETVEKLVNSELDELKKNVSYAYTCGSQSAAEAHVLQARQKVLITMKSIAKVLKPGEELDYVNQRIGEVERLDMPNFTEAPPQVDLRFSNGLDIEAAKAELAELKAKYE